jgi:quercetin dioxygenase-like cupin family protein
MRIITIIFLLLMSFILAGQTSQSQELPKGAIQLKPDDIKWIDAPPPMPQGSRIAILEGSPKGEGIFTIRVQFPPYFKVPEHYHPKEERVTVLSGAVYVGFGDAMDTTLATKFTTGSYYVNPAESHHYVFTQSEGVEIQITGLGPWGLVYLKDEKK